MAFVTIGTNLPSIAAQRRLQDVTSDLSGTFERLSSGLRITSAADDAAGLAIADQLRADSRIAAQAIRNANDGVSYVSIGDSALEEIGNVLTRMAELAEQSANGAITTNARSSLDSEFAALGSEIYRIARNTEFNGLNLLSGSSAVTLQVGLDSSSDSQITIQAVESTLISLGLGTTDTEALTYSLNGVNITDASTAATTALTAVQNAIDLVSSKRGTFGAVESRLTYAVSNLQVQRENLVSAESQIRDADVAFEAANLVRQQVVQQAASTVLSQANQQPALALSLLTG